MTYFLKKLSTQIVKNLKELWDNGLENNCKFSENRTYCKPFGIKAIFNDQKGRIKKPAMQVLRVWKKQQIPETVLNNYCPKGELSPKPENSARACQWSAK